jgi:PAS domain S-box-containing protein
MNEKNNPLQHFEPSELLKFIEEGLMLTDLEGKILSLNHAGSSVFGYGNSQELIGKNFRDLFWKPEDFSIFLDTLRKTGEIQEYLVFGRKRDGHPAYIQAYSRMHPLNSPSPDSIATLFKDVSERELFKRALERSEDRYKTLFNSISEGYARFNADDQVVFINPAGARILGFNNPMEVLGQQLTDTWRDKPAWEEFKARLLARGELFNEKIELELRDGRRVTLEVTERVVRNREGEPVGADALFRDITEQHALQERLVESAQKLHEIVSSCAEMMIVSDMEGKITFVNKAWEDICGYTSEQAVGQMLGHRVLEEDRPRVEAAGKEVRLDRPVSGIDLRLVRKDGSVVHTSWSASPLKDISGRIKGIIAIGRDVTEQRRAEEAIRRERDFSMSIIQTSPAFFVAIDSAGKLLLMNDAMLKALGYTAEEVIGKDYLPAFVPERERPAVSEVFKSLIRGQTTLTENRVLAKDGRELLVEWHGAPVFDAEGRFTHFFGIGINITERRKTEDALRESERFLLSIFSSIQDGISILDKDYNIIGVNPAMEKWYAHVMPLVGKKCYEAYHLGKETCTICPSRRVLETGEASREIVEYTGKGGKVIGWQELFSFPMFDDATGALKGVIEYVRDITERVQAEKRLKLMSSAVEQTSEGISVVDIEGNILFMNRAGAALYGYTPEELIGKNVSLLRPPDQAPGRAAFKQALETGEFRGELRCARKDGTQFMVHLRNSLLRNEAGQPVGIIATIRDISGIKESEQALLKEQEYSHYIIESANNIVFTLDLSGNLTTFNKFAEALTGYGRAEVLGKNYFDTFIAPEDRASHVDGFTKFIKGSPPVTSSNLIVCKDGTKRFIMWSSSLLTDQAGNITGTLSIGKDVTERKLAEEKLREEHEFSETILKTAPAFIIVMDAEGRIVKVNPTLEKIVGYTREELMGREAWEVLTPPELREKAKALFETMLKEGPRATAEYPIITRSGQTRTVLWCSDWVWDSEGRPKWIVSVGADVTETAALRQKASRSDSLYRSVVENSPNLIVRATPDGKIIFSGGTALLEYTLEDAVGRNVTDFVHPDDVNEARAAFAKAASGETVENFITRAVKKTGEIIYLSNNARPVRDEDGGVAEVQLTSRDITPLMRLQEQLKQYSENLEKLVGERTSELKEALCRRAEDERYSAKLYQIAPLAFVGTDENLLIRQWNAAAEKMFGYAAHEVVGKSPEMLVPPEKKADFAYVAQRNLRGEAVSGFESIGLHKSGRTFDVKLDSIALLGEKGEKIRGLYLIEDITQKKAAQREIEEARKRLQMVLEEIPEYGIFSADSEFIINYWGPGCEKLTGWKAEEVVGSKGVHILMPSLQGGAGAHSLHEAMFAGKPTAEPITIKRKDGSTVEVSTVLKPVRDKSGAMQGVVAVLRDISRESDMVDRLFDEARHKALGAVVVGISAEFNETLTRMERDAALAGEDPGFAKRIAAAVHEEVRRARALLDNLARFTRPAQQPFQLLSPVSVIDEIAQMLQGEFQLSGVRMVKTYHRVGDTLMRREDIQHALLNLILAAMSAAGKGGAVEITVQQENGIVSFEIKDNGPGIDMGDLGRVFDPRFWVEAGSGREKGRGLSATLGLGLITARRAAEEHGGTVEIESESGVGTTMKMKLPLKTVRRGRKTTRIIAARPPAAEKLPLRILVADDETHICSVIGYVAKEKEHICEAAGGLAEVRNLCADRKFDIAIIDRGLGDEVGLIATIGAIKTSNPRAQVYIITEEGENLPGGLKGICDGVLTHTFSVEDIQRLFTAR